MLSEWLEAVGEALDVPYAGKVATMRSLVEAIGMTWDPISMASTETPSGGAGNISLPAFEALLTGLRTQAAAQRRRDINDDPGPFVPGPPAAADDIGSLSAIRRRRGQPRFRAYLLDAYGGRCAISGCDAPAALEAAHIVAYGAGGTYELSNGVLLRADLHTLLDLRLLSFDGAPDFRVALHPELRASSYAPLSNLPLRPPARRADTPAREGLAAHRASCDF